MKKKWVLNNSLFLKKILVIYGNIAISTLNIGLVFKKTQYT